MGSAAMDALKYGGYLTSGLYASTAASSITDGSTSEASNPKPYSQMSPSSKQYLDSSSKLYGIDSGSMQQQQQHNSSHLKASSYTADSLSRSYFDAVQRASYGQQEPGKSYTPDTTGSGRASADSPDSSCNNKSGNNNSDGLMLGAESGHHATGVRLREPPLSPPSSCPASLLQQSEHAVRNVRWARSSCAQQRRCFVHVQPVFDDRGRPAAPASDGSAAQSVRVGRRQLQLAGSRGRCGSCCFWRIPEAALSFVLGLSS